MKILTRFVSTAVFLVGAFGSAAADDWRMYRKDSGRTAASTEAFTFPLKASWQYKSVRLDQLGAVSTVSTFGGNAYFLAGPPEAPKNSSTLVKRALICVDLATGKVQWTAPVDATRLHPFLREDVGPAITESGRVIVADTTTIYLPCPTTVHGLKAFHPATGEMEAHSPIPLKNALARFFLRQGHGESDYLLQPNAKPDS